ncbi:sigma-70 family RNA polymerase sigma factor [Clostridium tagluense]|uniref:RNA polymerase sigma factor n=1 Tax=Clostridium tagluense TaxID=360422 RepID=UPI001C0DCF3B|nr:sigma-70 family RNA polymerase sigma factor [Clostridium tagluense]MBU3128521.1 sigma-70 family RNA polymerase sigma factor [Clostridium tagluense]MCB2310403.1 sigma-70 family RNA polymerase sigma factor [Clostridium tagluense]MCB2315431.1 sigma-70 family RNA polymerase sigma factor [Clostridium tagluense]MCB2320284.1 sigma-70 family RNA polymerase sigma factor [Clostridium tagluense]MCB2325173.1 sigma-70 family RNA polymerase sigma factor [Clostridium tagluense]
MGEDSNLIGSILDGNVDSFNILVNKYEGIVLRFIYNMIKDKEAPEDITQEVFITVYNKLYLYDKTYKFINWLLQISKNKSIDYIRKYKRVYESNIEDIPNIISKEMSPEQSAEFMETKENVEEYLNSLNEVDRQILTIKYSQNLSFYDLSQIMEMTESNVKRKYYRSRQNFKTFISQKVKGCK